MTQPGVGFLISAMRGNAESVAAFSGAVGKTITSAAIRDDALHLAFADGTAICLYDDGQSCCESRYLTCDDDLSAHVGATLTDADVRQGPDEEKEYGDVHEVAFLVVTTSAGSFTVASHNEHNGYYGGISLRAAVVEGA